MADPVDQIVLLTGCSQEAARAAYDRHKDVILALDELMTIPETPGNRYIPPKTEIDRGMSKEQEERCLRARKVCDTINGAQKTAYQHAKTQADSVAPSVEPSSAQPPPPLPSEPHSES